MFFKPQRIHFVGIGGIGMSGIAEVLLNLGYQVSGSDARLTSITDRLASLGAAIHRGHDPSHIGDAKVVVISSAVKEDNPEVREARRRQLAVIPRGELLAELMRLKFGIAVAGSHGKTTTTSMIATLLSHAGLDPTVVVGGRVGAMGGTNARVGSSDFLVVESDESDGSFLKLAPILAIITNIDREHLDNYGTFEAVLAAFADFANKIPFYGATILCLDDENARQILPRIGRRVITYGRSPQADYVVSDEEREPFATWFRLRSRDHELGVFRLNAPGAHNVLNAAAAVATALELEVDLERIRSGLREYAGVERRFQIRGEVAGVTVVDDYGHHPTEIRATLETARQCGYRRALVLFQPHRYTRTQLLLDEFAGAFHQADRLYVLDIYAASEKPIEGVTAAALVERIREFGHRAAMHAGTLENAVEAALRDAEPGDAILTLGAGNVSQAGELLLRGLEERR
ncbi:MAG: UDP-N-acetylmuramate--L-alanine ligase [Bryobacteraceae bacterium]|nr:UDP-N-acetylmuramate--L-alanine ligase [Bryobacteraceae bacterium]